MKFILPVVCLALSIPTAVATASSGRLHGGGIKSAQAEKASTAETKAVRSLETKVRCFCVYAMVICACKKFCATFDFGRLLVLCVWSSQVWLGMNELCMCWNESDCGPQSSPGTRRFVYCTSNRSLVGLEIRRRSTLFCLVLLLHTLN